MQYVVGVLLFLTAACPAAAREVYYSDTCVEQESGDVAGYVVKLSDDGPRPVISLTWSEGSLKGPVQANVTEYDRTSGRLSFSAKTEWGEFSFQGNVGLHVIDGELLSPFDNPTHIRLEERSPKLANEPAAECK